MQLIDGHLRRSVIGSILEHKSLVILLKLNHRDQAPDMTTGQNLYAVADDLQAWVLCHLVAIRGLKRVSVNAANLRARACSQLVPERIAAVEACMPPVGSPKAQQAQT
jgi:hypothetical protein